MDNEVTSADPTLLARFAVNVFGAGPRTIMFAHGFGCDQAMWRYVALAFAHDHRVVVFDYVGAGASDLGAHDAEKYASLSDYAEDVVALARTLGIKHGVFVGHSVSAMIGILASKRAPELFEKLLLVGPSPRYIDDGDYVGGFTGEQIEELLEFLDSNYMGCRRRWRP
jgi:sigma-B regulation protein RsbQ